MIISLDLTTKKLVLWMFCFTYSSFDCSIFSIKSPFDWTGGELFQHSLVEELGWDLFSFVLLRWDKCNH